MGRKVMIFNIARISTGLSRSVINFCRCYSSLSISHIIKYKPFGQESCLQGWVKGIQKHKGVTFLHLMDGTSPQHLQVVLPESVAQTLAVTFGSCVKVVGTITESKGKGQAVEIFSNKIEIVGESDPFEFPFKQKQRHSPQYARDFLHLRPKHPLFNALLRIRNSASMAVHQYFQREGYIFIHTPILTSSDCEGGCEVFQIESLLPTRGSSSESEWDVDSDYHEDDLNRPNHFFSHPAYLTVSGQLHLEAITGAMKKVYNFGPTFRAENTRGSFHLSEFYMVEAEIAFTQSIDDLLVVMEDLVKFIYENVMKSCPDDVHFYTKSVTQPDYQKSVESMLSSSFKKMTYSDAIDALLKSNEDFKHEVIWGEDLKKEHEMYLTSMVGNVPLFVTDFPRDIKPFYAKRNNNSNTVAACDLLVPNVGELCGSSLREDRLDFLKEAINSCHMDQNVEWYLDLRKFGSCPHGGFGLGFERLLLFLLSAPGVKDLIPFPRWPGRCDL